MIHNAYSTPLLEREEELDEYHSHQQQQQQIFIATLTGDQQAPPVNTTATGMAIFKFDRTQNNTLGYEIVLNNIIDVTEISLNQQQEENDTDRNGPVIATLYQYMGPMRSEICCRSAEASEPRTYYVNGSMDNTFVLTWIDLLKSGERLSMSSGGGSSSSGTDISDGVSNNNSSNNNQTLAADSNLTITLTDMFNSKSVYVNIETESNPLGEIRGQVTDAILLPQ